jgi:hypothetical protein
MLYEVFSIYDSKAEAYLPPFILPKIAQAKRIFEQCINSDDHQFGQSPADYTLFRLGNFDDSNGQYLLARATESLGNGIEFLHPEGMDTAGAGNGKDQSQSQEQFGSSVLDGSTGEDSKE